jgi:hypothetical protein
MHFSQEFLEFRASKMTVRVIVMTTLIKKQLSHRQALHLFNYYQLLKLALILCLCWILEAKIFNRPNKLVVGCLIPLQIL